MSLFQALAYFLEEALSNLVRGWRISSLAIATTALSLFIGATLALVGSNLGRAVEVWRSDARVVIYLEEEIPEEALAAIQSRIAGEPALGRAELVSSEEAYSRFADRFPELGEVARDLERSPFPASIEVHELGERERVAAALGRVGNLDGVSEVDDDGEWLESMDAVAAVASVLGFTVGGVLIVAAAVSIASVVRLSTFIYRKEIGAMRLIGATEFFVRGPFVVEGLVQGMLGSILALVGLWAGYRGLGSLDLPWLVEGGLMRFFLTVSQALGLVALGGLAGLIGGLIPLREKSGVFG